MVQPTTVRGITFLFLVAGHMYRTNFGIGHSMKDLLDAHVPPGGRVGRGHKGLYDTINNSLHFQLGLALASLGVITSLVAQHMYSLPAYAFIAQDFTTQAALYTHHQYIAGFIMTGSADPNHLEFATPSSDSMRRIFSYLSSLRAFFLLYEGYPVKQLHSSSVALKETDSKLIPLLNRLKKGTSQERAMECERQSLVISWSFLNKISLNEAKRSEVPGEEGIAFWSPLGERKGSSLLNFLIQLNRSSEESLSLRDLIAEIAFVVHYPC
ncbi:photosystem I P700 chlorophyll a apoprotein A2 [Striga asiatica]|uniref:Photosystem I P700 chlorophyll a apoprotein A2 n=1 Tax=Striga asiatica TaxID=4170 RepID=A0A5A7QL84_STRAF|nr:photosystem I P700 chlorophyll a apoprotein A2 [Striga asiatica]